MRNIAEKQKFKLGSNQYKQKANSNDFVKAVEKIQNVLQDEVNLKYGRNAPKISYAYVTKHIYDNYLKGKNIK